MNPQNPERVARSAVAVKGLRQQVDARVARRDLLAEQLASTEAEVASAERLAETCTQARTLLETLSDTKRELVREKIEALVTHGLQAVYGPSYVFEIRQGTARGHVTFDYILHHEFGGERHESPLRGFHGGGLVAVVGFLLRVVMVLFTHPPRRRILFLDETFANVDADKREALARLIHELGTKLSMQFVLITHSQEYSDIADHTYEVRNTGGTARVVPA